MSTITIPPEALMAAARALWKKRKSLFGPAFPRLAWEELSDAKRGELLDEARAAIAAALAAWPGFEYRSDVAFPAFGYGPSAFILPLPQEKNE